MKNRKFASKSMRSRFCRLGVEELESRRMLANLVWTNRGQTSDRFAEVFGAQAESARQVVDAVLTAWGTVLTDLKQPAIDSPADRNTINFTIGMHASDPGFGGAASISQWAFPSEADKAANRNGHPVAGDFTLSRGQAGEPNNGWWIDPTPSEHSEFTNILSPFAAARPDDAVGTDLYGTINAEIAHILGLFDTAPSRLPTPISGTVTKTTSPDQAHGGGVGFYYVFDGPSGTHLLTSYDSGAGDVNGPTHTAGPTAANYPVAFTSQFRGAVSLRGGIDPGNAAGGNNTRVLANDGVVLLLKDAFGYEVRLPSTIPGATFAVAVQGQTLNVRGGPDGDATAAGTAGTAATGGAGRGYDTFIPDYVDVGRTSADRITLLRDGDEVVITVDFGRDGPVNGLDPDGDGNAPAFVTRVPLDSFTSINVDSDGGNDTIILDFSGGDFLPEGGLEFEGDLGVDKIIVSGTHTYRIDGEALNMDSVGTVFLDSVNEVHLIGTSLDDTFDVRNWDGLVTFEGLGGSDSYVIDWSVRGRARPRIIDSSGFADLVQVTGTDRGDVFFVTGSIVRMLGSVLDFRGVAIEQLTIFAGAGSDMVSVLSPPVGAFVRAFGGEGNDLLFGSRGSELLSGDEGNDIINGGRGSDILLGGDGNDILTAALIGIDRSVLIGGLGSDVLTGGGLGSILIGGSTNYGNDEMALRSILAVWSRLDLTYAARLDQLRNGGLTNGTNVLTGVTVPDDNTRDTIFGSLLGQDWYWAAVTDLVIGRIFNEQTN